MPAKGVAVLDPVAGKRQRGRFLSLIASFPSMDKGGLSVALRAKLLRFNGGFFAAQKARYREIAERLDAHRKRQLALHATLTMTDMYNALAGSRGRSPSKADTQPPGMAGRRITNIHQGIAKGEVKP